MSKYLFPILLILAAAGFLAWRANEAIETRQAEQALAAQEKPAPEFRPEAPGPKAAVLKKGPDSHFWADANVNGSRIRLMVDTGATSVALTREDALRIGLKPDELDYSYRVGTAGGETRGAFVLLDEIRIGNVTVKQVGALVIEADLKQSLLGMSFLGELYSYEVRKSSMIIRQ